MNLYFDVTTVSYHGLLRKGLTVRILICHFLLCIFVMIQEQTRDKHIPLQ